MYILGISKNSVTALEHVLIRSVHLCSVHLFRDCSNASIEIGVFVLSCTNPYGNDFIKLPLGLPQVLLLLLFGASGSILQIYITNTVHV